MVPTSGQFLPVPVIPTWGSKGVKNNVWPPLWRSKDVGKLQAAEKGSADEFEI